MLAAEDATYIPSAPGNAIHKLLNKVKISIDEIDLMKSIEAFVAMALLLFAVEPRRAMLSGKM